MFLCKTPFLMFQSTRPRGARPILRIYLQMKTRFNPRAREGRDTPVESSRRTMRSFNPRAREGRDIIACCSAGVT